MSSGRPVTEQERSNLLAELKKLIETANVLISNVAKQKLDILRGGPLYTVHSSLKNQILSAQTIQATTVGTLHSHKSTAQIKEDMQILERAIADTNKEIAAVRRERVSKQPVDFSLPPDLPPPPPPPVSPKALLAVKLEECMKALEQAKPQLSNDTVVTVQKELDDKKKELAALSNDNDSIQRFDKDLDKFPKRLSQLIKAQKDYENTKTGGYEDKKDEKKLRISDVKQELRDREKAARVIEIVDIKPSSASTVRGPSAGSETVNANERDLEASIAVHFSADAIAGINLNIKKMLEQFQNEIGQLNPGDKQVFNLINSDLNKLENPNDKVAYIREKKAEIDRVIPAENRDEKFVQIIRTLDKVRVMYDSKAKADAQIARENSAGTPVPVVGEEKKAQKVPVDKTANATGETPEVLSRTQARILESRTLEFEQKFQAGRKLYKERDSAILGAEIENLSKLTVSGKTPDQTLKQKIDQQRKAGEPLALADQNIFQAYEAMRNTVEDVVGVLKFNNNAIKEAAKQIGGTPILIPEPTKSQREAARNANTKMNELYPIINAHFDPIHNTVMAQLNPKLSEWLQAIIEHRETTAQNLSSNFLEIKGDFKGKNEMEANAMSDLVAAQLKTICGGEKNMNRYLQCLRDTTVMKRYQAREQANATLLVEKAIPKKEDLLEKRLYDEEVAAKAQRVAQPKPEPKDAIISPAVWESVKRGAQRDDGMTDDTFISRYFQNNPHLVNQRDKDGNTILHYLAERATTVPASNIDSRQNYGVLIQNLISGQGADPFMPNMQGKTPLDMAVYAADMADAAKGKVKAMSNDFDVIAQHIKNGILAGRDNPNKAEWQQKTYDKWNFELLRWAQTRDDTIAGKKEEEVKEALKDLPDTHTSMPDKGKVQQKQEQMARIVVGIKNTDLKDIVAEFKTLSERLTDYLKTSNLVKDLFTSNDAKWKRYHELKPMIMALAAQESNKQDPERRRLISDAQYILAKESSSLDIEIRVLKSAKLDEKSQYKSLMFKAVENKNPEAMFEVAKANMKADSKDNRAYAAELFQKILELPPANDDRVQKIQKDTSKYLRDHRSFLKEHPEVGNSLISAEAKLKSPTHPEAQKAQEQDKSIKHVVSSLLGKFGLLNHESDKSRPDTNEAPQNPNTTHRNKK